MKNDILNIEDVKLLVNRFYTKVREDAMLADIFNQRIGDKWSEHLEKMYRFWQTVLLEEHTYFGSPFLPHANLPVEKQHFEQWLNLFNETVNELFSGTKAERAKWQGERMAQMFLSKIEYHRKHSTKPLL
ncbi:group III truncated hemoglobin [Reichenbachiella sp. MALMAid0571]|uniref:group III truncated hemoglobin n=1 Tax=Reichenbachiella sp. MALMAid0571 TaxID=3143939 RepID=UPI0032DEEDA5